MSQNKESNILISFVLPTYNVERYIRNCIESIESQDFQDIGYEIICVEDQSTDGTRELLESLRNDHLRIIYNQKNSGPSFSRNVGLCEAKGKYVWFVDSDDLLYPDCIRRGGILKLLEEHRPDALTMRFLKVPEEFAVDAQFQMEPFPTSFSWEETLFAAAPIEADTKKTMTTVWGVLFKTELLRKENLTFDEDMSIGEDTDFYMFFPRKNVKILRTESICYLYRQRAGSLLHSSARYRYGYLTNLRILEKYIRLHSSETQSGKAQKKSEKAMLANLKYNVAQTLVMVNDRAYVKEQLKILREKGYYPFRWNISALKNKRVSVIKRLSLFLLPVYPIFLLINRQCCKSQNTHNKLE